MNLIIDAGNTNVKIAVFQQNILKITAAFKKELFSEKILETLQKFSKVTHIITSSVTKLSEADMSYLHKLPQRLYILSHTTPVPFTNKYATPQTLGVDRIALVAAAVAQYPKQNVLVIDAGTCITYDIKTAKEIYLGGGIAPGIQLRYDALHLLTANLPKLSPQIPENYIGDSTESAIHSGVSLGVIYEIDAVIDQYKQQFEHLTVILTGGDANFLAKRLKNSIFANSKFLLQGLNHILEYNRHND